MDRFKRSWQLVKSSWSVLRADKELMLFPVASGITLFIAMLLVGLVWMTSGGLDRLGDDGIGIIDLVFLYVFYFVVSTVGVFFNSALIAAANIRLDGGDPSLSDGFRIALSHLPAILGWAAIAASVGLILQAIRERAGALGAIVSLIGTMAWGLITFLVVPILVVEGVGPIEAIKRSAGLLRKTWGEQIVGNFSIGLVTGLIFIAVMLGGGAIAFLLFNVSDILGILAFVLLVLVLVIVGLIGSTLSGIFNIALYRYASGKEADAFFPQETLAGAFKQK